MIRFISFLLGKHYEPCKGCDTLREQLAIANAEKKEMLDTILNLVKPQVIVPQSEVKTTVVKPQTTVWRVRQRELEESSRNQERIRIEQKAEADRLEKQLGIASSPRETAVIDPIEEVSGY